MVVWCVWHPIRPLYCAAWRKARHLVGASGSVGQRQGIAGVENVAGPLAMLAKKRFAVDMGL